MSKKLVIRINNLQDNENDDTYEVSEETVIHWDRVIAASALALILLVVLIWGGWQLFSKASPAQVDEAPFTHSDLNSQTPALRVAPEHAATAKKTAGHKELKATVVTENEQLPIDADGSAIVESAENEAAQQARNMPVEKVGDAVKAASGPKVDVPNRSQAIPAKADTDLVENRISAEETVSVEGANGLANPEKEKVINSPDPVVIESARIVKAQLTHRVKNSEPVDKLGSVISMNDDTLIRVYLFTGMEGLKGETLYHDWYLSGKRMARVKINVKNNKTSASSSKFIDRHMTGDWRVKVTTSRGDELVSARFNVVN